MQQGAHGEGRNEVALRTGFVSRFRHCTVVSFRCWFFSSARGTDAVLRCWMSPVRCASDREEGLLPGIQAHGVPWVRRRLAEVMSWAHAVAGGGQKRHVALGGVVRAGFGQWQGGRRWLVHRRSSTTIRADPHIILRLLCRFASSGRRHRPLLFFSPFLFFFTYWLAATTSSSQRHRRLLRRSLLLGVVLFCQQQHAAALQPQSAGGAAGGGTTTPAHAPPQQRIPHCCFFVAA